MFKFTTKKIAVCGIISALYVATSLITFPVASGAMQIRLSEGLTLLPLLIPESIIAVFIGCLLSNLLTGCALFDIIFGSLITLVAGVFTYLIGKTIKNTALKIFTGGLFPVLLNAFLLPLIWFYCYGKLEYLYLIQVGLLLVSQSVSVYLVGSFCYFATKRYLKTK